MTEHHRVWVFFYGTFMNPDVLLKHGVVAQNVIAARLQGFELIIRPRVNLIPSDHSCVFGSVMTVTHDDLEKIYSDLLETFGLSYLPEAVVAETMDGMLRPALCYIAAGMSPAEADPVYVQELAACARALKFPEWYVQHVESFGKID